MFCWWDMIRNFSSAHLLLYIILSEVSIKVCGPVFMDTAFLLLLHFKNFFVYVGGSLLTDMSFENIFFCQSVACLLNLLPISCRTELLILMKSRWSIISFMYCAFGILSKKSSPCPGHLVFLLYYLLGVIWFCILHLDL